MTLNSQVIPGKAEGTLDQSGRTLVFLHGLFGKALSFRFLARKKEIQQNFNVHLVDLRNHGGSGWHHEMNYELMAQDLLGYLDNKGLAKEKSLSLVGHSMGGKTAMVFASMFPELVHQLVSLDSPPVNRNLPEFAKINEHTERLIDCAVELGDLT